MYFLLFTERFQASWALGIILKWFCFFCINFHWKDAPAHSFPLFASLVEFQILGNRNKRIQNSLSECFPRMLHFDVIAWKGHYPFFPYYLFLANRNSPSTGGTRERNRNKTSQDFSAGKKKPESGQESNRHLCPSVRHCLTRHLSSQPFDKGY